MSWEARCELTFIFGLSSEDIFVRYLNEPREEFCGEYYSCKFGVFFITAYFANQPLFIFSIQAVEASMNSDHRARPQLPRPVKSSTGSSSKVTPPSPGLTLSDSSLHVIPTFPITNVRTSKLRRFYPHYWLRSNRNMRSQESCKGGLGERTVRQKWPRYFA